jgi:hypothetical protein
MMKKYLFAILISCSFTTLAADICYNVSKEGNEVGNLCLDKNLKEVRVGESVDVSGNFDNVEFNYNYVRLQDRQYKNCIRPKDRLPICTLIKNAFLILPKPPLNKIGLPSIPAEIVFILPDLTKGKAGNYIFTLEPQ